MAIFIIESGLDEKQNKMIQDIFKYLSLFIVFHILVNLSDLKNIGLFDNGMFNENFIVFLLLLAITIMAYYLVILELIDII